MLQGLLQRRLRPLALTLRRGEAVKKEADADTAAVTTEADADTEAALLHDNSSLKAAVKN